MQTLTNQQDPSAGSFHHHYVEPPANGSPIRKSYRIDLDTDPFFCHPILVAQSEASCKYGAGDLGAMLHPNGSVSCSSSLLDLVSNKFQAPHQTLFTYFFFRI